VWKALRKNDFQGRVARIKPFISHKNRKVQMKFAENHLQRVSDGHNYVWWEPGKELRKKNIFIQRSSMLVLVWGCGHVWQHQEWEIFTLSKASWTYMFIWILFENIWKPVLENLGLYHENCPKYSSYLVSGALNNCPKVIKTPPQSQLKCDWKSLVYIGNKNKKSFSFHYFKTGMGKYQTWKKASNVNSRSSKRSHCKQSIANAVMKEFWVMTNYYLIYN